MATSIRLNPSVYLCTNPATTSDDDKVISAYERAVAVRRRTPILTKIFNRSQTNEIPSTLLSQPRRYDTKDVAQSSSTQFLCFYGQSGSGKSTLARNTAKQALVSDRSNVHAQISVLELLGKEHVTDLLGDMLHRKLDHTVKDSIKVGMMGSKVLKVKTTSELERLMTSVDQRRTKGETMRNDQSSRRHMLIILSFSSGNSLCLLDLCGSERTNQNAPDSFNTTMKDERNRETIMINKDLLELKSICQAFMQGMDRDRAGKNPILLGRIFTQSLRMATSCGFVICLSGDHMQETVNSISWGFDLCRLRKVEIQAAAIPTTGHLEVSSMPSTPELVQQSRIHIEELTVKLNQATAKLAESEKQNESLIGQLTVADKRAREAEDCEQHLRTKNPFFQRIKWPACWVPEENEAGGDQT